MRPRTAMAVDAIFLLVFAAVGRRSHHEHDSVFGVLATALPFLIGAAAGWAVVRGWRAPRAITPTGVSVWLGAVWIGMLLRALTGQAVAWSFLLVASAVTALFLLGWRLIVNTLVVVRSRG
ncbi:DUF3054 domain-containing protein [Segniliparus rugosus]|nr:DUF3054 domain-containing protein [Segniliparus rugosus]